VRATAERAANSPDGRAEPPARASANRLMYTSAIKTHTAPLTWMGKLVRRSGMGSRWNSDMYSVHSGAVNPCTRSPPGFHTSP